MRNIVNFTLAFVLQNVNALEVQGTAIVGSTVGQPGVIDLPMTMLRPDGRDPDQTSVFEIKRQRLEQARLSSQTDKHLLGVSAEFDLDMQMLMDWNHVIELTMKRANDTVQVIPNTRDHLFMLNHPNCNDCFSMHGTSWKPDNTDPITESQVSIDYDFFYMMHTHSSKLLGKYWKTGVCFATPEGYTGEKACAKEYPVFSINMAEPWYFTLGDGQLGLEPRTLLAMTRDGMISAPVMGIHTQLYNSTQDPSQIRFGGFNEDLIPSGHSQAWLKTLNDTTWEVEVHDVSFHGDKIFEDTKALINPGYPFIGMPEAPFETLVKDLMSNYPTEKLNCKDLDWCYYKGQCSLLFETMADLTFTFATSDGGRQTVKVPPSSFLYNDKDKKTGKEICHLGVIGQKHASTEGWILGQAFMENFYVTFDATDLQALKIGVSQLAPKPRPSDNEDQIAPSTPTDPTKNEPTGSEETTSENHLHMFVMLGVAVVTIFLLVIIIHCSCAIRRRRRLVKIEKTREFLESMKNPQPQDDNRNATIQDSSATINLDDTEDIGETLSFGETA